MPRIELFFTLFILFSLVIGGNADGEGCNGDAHGISCCYKAFTAGDNNGGIEKFIQADQYNIGCFETCKKLHPGSIGITVSVKQKYQSGNGKGRGKCWCELGTPKLDATNQDYKTCVFKRPGAHALVLNDRVSCVSANGSFFGQEGGRIKAFPRINVGEEIHINMAIKPQNLTGMLVGVRGPKDYVILEMVNGRVVFRAENGKGEIITSLKPNTQLNNGNFHKINAIKAGNAVTMIVDGIFANAVPGMAGITKTDTNNPLFIGGHARPDMIPRYPGTFQGCIKDVSINTKRDNSINNLHVTSDMVFGDVAI